MGKHGVNDIDNEMNEVNINVIDNDRRYVNKKRSRRVDMIADNLVRRFKAPGSREFFCKVAWKMSENEIETIFEKSHAPGIMSPIKYFVTACNNKIR